MLEKDVLHTSDKSAADIFISYFKRITETLEIPSREHHTLPLNPEISLAKFDFKSHPSIKEMNSHRFSEEKFDFTKVEQSDVLDAILSLNISKSVSGTILTRMLRYAANICAPFLTTCFNDCLESGTFPDGLKLADIIPSFEKGSSTDKSNYRPISLLPVFERLIVNQ